MLSLNSKGSRKFPRRKRLALDHPQFFGVEVIADYSLSFASIINPEDVRVTNLDFTLPIRALVKKWLPNAYP